MKKLEKAFLEKLDQLISSKLKDVKGGKSNTGTQNCCNSIVAFTISNKIPPLNGAAMTVNSNL